MVNSDHEALLELLNKHRVRYGVIGGCAVAFHGHARYTKDLDILVDPSADNSKHLLEVIQEFEYGGMWRHATQATESGRVARLGRSVDLFTAIVGRTFGQVWEHRVEGRYGNQWVFFIGREDLIRSKQLFARPQDQLDVTALRKSRVTVSSKKDRRQSLASAQPETFKTE